MKEAKIFAELLGDVSEGVAVLSQHGKKAYREWLRERLQWLFALIDKVNECVDNQYKYKVSNNLRLALCRHREWIERQIELVSDAIRRQEVRALVVQNQKDRGYDFGPYGNARLWSGRENGHGWRRAIISSVRRNAAGELIGSRNTRHESRERRECRLAFIRARDQRVEREFREEVRDLDWLSSQAPTD